MKSASTKSITYSEEFKAYFVAEYEAGKTPSGQHLIQKKFLKKL